MNMHVRQFEALVADPFAKAERLLCSFSRGVTSAVGIKIALDVNAGRLPVEIVNFDTHSEHPDGLRFLRDCEAWYGHPINIMSSSKYKDIWDVFTRERYIAGIAGAKCTTVLKKQLRERIERVTDLQVFGFDAAEARRASRFWTNQPEVMGWFPLLDAGLSKEKCKAMLVEAGIDLPVMYSLGFDNNNCIGCPKGGNAYWNNIRRHFPETFDRMAALGRDLGVRQLKRTINGVSTRFFLDELPLDARDEKPVDMSCGVVCDQGELFSDLEDAA